MKKKTFLEMLKPASLLAGFAFFGILVLATLDLLTQDKIAENERLALIKQFNVLIAKDQYDNDPLTDVQSFSAEAFQSKNKVTVYRAKKGKQVVTAFFVLTSRKGYSGDIRLLVAVKPNLSLAGVRVLAHKETPGLGDKIEITKSDWIRAFDGKSLKNPPVDLWKVNKDGGKFDQFTGATITPRAIVNTVKQVLIETEKNKNKIFNHD